MLPALTVAAASPAAAPAPAALAPGLAFRRLRGGSLGGLLEPRVPQLLRQEPHRGLVRGAGVAVTDPQVAVGPPGVEGASCLEARQVDLRQQHVAHALRLHGVEFPESVLVGRHGAAHVAALGQGLAALEVLRRVVEELTHGACYLKRRAGSGARSRAAREERPSRRAPLTHAAPRPRRAARCGCGRAPWRAGEPRRPALPTRSEPRWFRAPCRPPARPRRRAARRSAPVWLPPAPASGGAWRRGRPSGRR